MLQVALRYRWLPWQRGGNVIRYVDRQQNGGRHDLTFSMNEQGDLGQGDIEDRPPRSGVGNREKPAELAIGALRVPGRHHADRAPLGDLHLECGRELDTTIGQRHPTAQDMVDDTSVVLSDQRQRGNTVPSGTQLVDELRFRRGCAGQLRSVEGCLVHGADRRTIIRTLAPNQHGRQHRWMW